MTINKKVFIDHHISQQARRESSETTKPEDWDRRRKQAEFAYDQDEKRRMLAEERIINDRGWSY